MREPPLIPRPSHSGTILPSVGQLPRLSIQDSLFPPNEAVLNLKGYSIADLRHVYTSDRIGLHGQPMDFSGAEDYMKRVDAEVRKAYYSKNLTTMNTYDPTVAAAVRSCYLQHPSTGAAFRALGLPETFITGACIPWWNECAAHESDITVARDSVLVKIAPRHSIETQLRRSGYDIPVKNISVGGVVVTAPSERHPRGEIILGLRGGLTARNIFHIPAGALKLTDEILQGKHTMADFLLKVELKEEFGIEPAHITALRPLARYSDASIGLDVYYTFATELRISSAELDSAWRANTNPDKQEHQALVAVDARPEHVASFIKRWYRGKAQNIVDRPDSDRCLLHAAAVAMAVYAELDPQQLLRPLCKEHEV